MKVRRTLYWSPGSKPRETERRASLVVTMLPDDVPAFLAKFVKAVEKAAKVGDVVQIDFGRGVGEYVKDVNGEEKVLAAKVRR